MVTKTITEQRAEVRIFAGNDPAHTATGSSGISSATPALTPLMLDEATGNLQVSVEDLVRTGAFLVAMSLWHNHPQKTQSPSMNEAVMKIEQEVLTTWPADAIARAEDVVLCLSGMIEAVRPDTDITEVAKNNTLTDDDFSAGKSSTAS